MGFLDKIKDYLNEEDDISEEEMEKATSIVSSEEESSDAPEEEELDEEEQPKKGFFSKLSEKRKSKRASREALSEDSIVKNSGLSSVKAKKYMENERKTVQDFCEQLIDVSFHAEEIKREYKVVTSYLTDIQRIEDVPVDMANKIIGISQKIEMLDKNRETYLQSENLLPMDQYNNLSALENDVVDTIKNLNDMEMRDSMLRNDMGYLEGEKEDLRYMRGEYAAKIVRLRGIIITILVLFLITSLGMLMYSFTTKNSVTMYAMIVGAIAALAFVTCYIRYMDLKTAIKDGDAKIKRAVSLLNKVKVKYINNTSTMEYVYEKYGVHSCKELEYQWELYNTMVRDAKRYMHANKEFKNHCDELVDIMTKIGVNDPLVWPKQTNAIIDRREMVEIKHSLNVRRQKLRERLVTCEKIRDNAQIALRAAVAANPGMENYITDMLKPYNITIDVN